MLATKPPPWARRQVCVCSQRGVVQAAPTRRELLLTGAGGAQRGLVQTPTRRELLLTGAGGALLLPSGRVAAAPVLDGAGKTVLLTGANTGIGFDAARKLAARGFDVTLACRTADKARTAVTELTDAAGAAGLPLTGKLRGVECDLASLESVRQCVKEVQGTQLNALVLNAGVQFSGDNTLRRTADGFEITIGTNHLGHFLLANLLLPGLQRTPGARIVVTASEVHDPSSPGGSVGPGASLGSLSGLRDRSFVMVDGSSVYDADKAYKDSKLCNVLFTRELARRLAASGSKCTANCFGPGLITRTGFFRNQNPLFVGVFDFLTNDVFHVAESVSGGGDCLVFMVCDPKLEGKNGVYFNNDLDGKGGHTFHEDAVSAEARNDAEAGLLWERSCELVGLQSTAV
jgi:protochlorophyllide reductase